MLEKNYARLRYITVSSICGSTCLKNRFYCTSEEASQPQRVSFIDPYISFMKQNFFQRTNVQSIILISIFYQGSWEKTDYLTFDNSCKSTSFSVKILFEYERQCGIVYLFKNKTLWRPRTKMSIKICQSLASDVITFITSSMIFSGSKRNENIWTNTEANLLPDL